MPPGFTLSPAIAGLRRGVDRRRGLERCYTVNPTRISRRESSKMSQTTEQQGAHPLPLTALSEEEEMFRASVREFAEGELRPRVEEMDEHGKLDPLLIKQCFELGLMGIETSEEFGG